MERYTLTIKGFKTKAQVRAFASWYEGQGEQDASIWFECRQEKGEIDVGFMPVDCAAMHGLWDKFDEYGNMDLILKI